MCAFIPSLHVGKGEGANNYTAKNLYFLKVVLDYYAVTMAQIVTVKCKQTNLKYKFEILQRRP